MSAVIGSESVHAAGALRYADPYRFDRPETAALRMLEREWRDLQGQRKAFQQRESDPTYIDALRKLEDRASRRLRKGLEAHPLWPWLSQLPGLAGPLTACVMSAIGNPHRFPGQQCTEGHYLPVGARTAGERCPLVLADGAPGTDAESGEDDLSPADRVSEGGHAPGGGSLGADSGAAIERMTGANTSGAADESDARDELAGCPGIMLEPRPGTGVRSVWHLLGLHAVEIADGKSVSPRRQRGFQCDWNPSARATILMPDVGMAAQIVKHRTQPYRQRYDDAKARLAAERPDWRPIQVDRCAQKIAVKVFIGDLVVAWKALA